jgi:hypothetical protein
MKRTKTGGRQAGTPNRTTKALRTWITDFITANTKQIENDWQSLEPKERITAFQQLLKYALPTLQAVNVTTDIEKELEALSDERLEELMNKILDHYQQ